MSRILRRPMFRGGSTSNEGIMSVPRKKYEEGTDEEGVQGEETNAGNIYKAFGKINVEKGSIQDEIYQDYIGRKADPASKFLINFGLNYMSARPRSGKLGFLTTAADAGKAPVKELYEDIDKERLLKLKVMTALSKGDSKVALEKEARLLVANNRERYPDMKTALNELMRIRAEKKTLTPEERVAAREKSFDLDQPLVKRAKAEIFEIGLPKLGKERKNVDLNNAFIDQGQLIQKPNSTDAQLIKPPQNIEKSYKVGKIYIDLESRNAYKYTGPNTFRFLASLE
jgi:hypothetical protein